MIKVLAANIHYPLGIVECMCQDMRVTDQLSVLRVVINEAVELPNPAWTNEDLCIVLATYLNVPVDQISMAEVDQPVNHDS